ncbi:MAG: sugar ABC transporter substrate-binding protein [Firmicutes bacterium]|nr:sugar ABC transporter substrate-binding protein [Bacillota bacterium]
MVKRKMIVFLLVVTLVMVSVVGCSSQTEKVNKLNLQELYASVSDEKVVLDIKDIIDTKAKKEYTIGVAMNTVSTPFFKALADSIQASLKEAGAKPLLAVCDEDASKQVSQIENFITQGVDAIIIKPADPAETLSIALDKAYQANIPVIAVDAPPAEDAKYLCAFITDAYDLGFIVGEEIAKQLLEANPTGEIEYGIIGAIDGNTIATIRNMASRDGIASVDAEGRIKEVAYLFSGGFSEEGGLQTAENMLVAHPNLKAIIGTCDAHVIGATAAAERQGKADQIIMGAIDGSKTAMEIMMNGGPIKALAWNSPQEVGRAGATATIRLLNGDEVPASKTMVIKAVLITPENVKDIYDPNSAF